MSDCLLGLLFSFSLLLAGVFGADDVTVSVMMGESVTLPIKPGEINERLQWKYKNSIIASFNVRNKDIPAVYPNERFTNRLNVDPQTGSLTVKNIGTEDTGEYQLEIKTSNTPDYKLFRTFSVTVNDQEITVSAMKGDNLSLPTDVKIKPDKVKWKINDTDLTDKGFDNIDVNLQTGQLYIRNIRPEQSGKYDVQINSRDLILHRIFRVNVNANEGMPVSKMEGETLTLSPDTKTQEDDVIKWMFEETLIAKMDRRIHPQPDPVLDKRFSGRLHMDSRGYLYISHIKTNESGIYDVNITNSNHIVQKRFRVTVTGSSSRSHQVMIGPGLFVLVIMSVIVLV
ncbi:uncharacterized protein [Misgurnus anguillicaudatus]|uniref:uncharacterized protein n=1 Tax=Misgurnus anguillicaudatus TaxID=75329 RepID=UPI003CCF9C74